MWRRGGPARVVFLGLGLALCPIGCVESMLDFGSFMDGPAVGQFSDSVASVCVSQVLFLVGCVLAWLSWWHARGRRERSAAVVVGLGTARDVARAAVLYRHGCDGGDEFGCRGLLDVVPGDAGACGSLDRLCRRPRHTVSRDFACEAWAKRCRATGRR